jgi:antitoxin ParD1/3/4
MGRDTVNIDLPPEATQFIEGLVASGEYGSAEEAVAEGIRLLMGRQRLRAEIQKGIDELDSGQGIEGRQVFAELRQRAKKLTEQSG